MFDTYSHLNGNLEKEEYKEGIYTGYRYFDSFGINPLYSFGYGLSYTTFGLKFCGMETEKGAVRVRVMVTNTGKCFSGREVVQVYISLPQGKIEKESRRLAGFIKTKRLDPGESREVTTKIRQKQLAVYYEERQEWVVEAGNVWHMGGKQYRLCAAFCVSHGSAGSGYGENPPDLSQKRLF